MDIRKRIKQEAKRLQKARAEASCCERYVQSQIDLYVKTNGRGTAKTLADELGVSQSYLSDIRHHLRSIGDDTLAKIVDISG